MSLKKIPPGAKVRGLLTNEKTKGKPTATVPKVGFKDNLSTAFARKRNAGRLPGASQTPGPKNHVTQQTIGRA